MLAFTGTELNDFMMMMMTTVEYPKIKSRTGPVGDTREQLTPNSNKNR
jgi:hypothetical protein